MITDVASRIATEIEHWRRSSWTFEAVRQHYDRLAEDYDAINEGTNSYFRRFTDAMRLAQLPDRAYVLDICARTGNGTAYFYRQGKIEKAVCADVSPEMGRICTHQLREIGFYDFRWTQIYDYDWPFADLAFDVVLSLETVEHFDDPQRFIGELGRVTRPGGTLLLSTPNVLWEPLHALAAITGLHHSEGPHRFISMPRLRQYLSRAGFEIVSYQTNVIVPGGPTWLIQAGRWIEDRMNDRLRSAVGLRRLFACRKLL